MTVVVVMGWSNDDSCGCHGVGHGFRWSCNGCGNGVWWGSLSCEMGNGVRWGFQCIFLSQVVIFIDYNLHRFTLRITMSRV